MYNTAPVASPPKILGLTPARAVLLAVAVGLLARLAVTTFLNIAPISDSLDYYRIASSLVEYGNMVHYGGSGAFFSPGYPLLVLFPTFLLAGKSVAAAQVVNSLLGALGVWLTYECGRVLFRSPWAAVAAAWGWAVYIESAVYAEYLAKENLMVPLLLLQLLLTASLPMSRRGTLACFLAGLVYGLQALTGPTAVFFLPLTIWQILRSPHSWLRRIVHCALLLLTMAAVMTPWLMRNARVVGAPVLTTHSWMNLYAGNNPNATGYGMLMSETPLAEEYEKAFRQGELAADRVAKRGALEYMRANPGTTIRRTLWKGYLFWKPPFHKGLEPNPQSSERAARLIWGVQYLILCGLALCGIVAARIAWSECWTPWLLVFIFTAVHMVFLVAYRYRLAIMPVVCLLAGWGLANVALPWFAARFRRSR